MRCPIWILALVVALPAAAQVESPFGSGLSFSQADVAAIQEASAPFFRDEPAEPGAQRSWSNPESGLSGTARYEGPNEMDGRPCRQIRHLIRSARSDRVYEYRVDRCRQPDGTWAIAAAAWMVN